MERAKIEGEDDRAKLAGWKAELTQLDLRIQGFTEERSKLWEKYRELYIQACSARQVELKKFKEEFGHEDICD